MIIEKTLGKIDRTYRDKLGNLSFAGSVFKNCLTYIHEVYQPLTVYLYDDLIHVDTAWCYVEYKRQYSSPFRSEFRRSVAVGVEIQPNGLCVIHRGSSVNGVVEARMAAVCGACGTPTEFDQDWAISKVTLPVNSILCPLCKRISDG